MLRFICSTCVADLTVNESPCPWCGCPDRHIYADVETAVGVETRIGLKGRHGAPGEVKPYLEHKTEIKWNHDRQRNERCDLVVDRENDCYRQSWYHLDTGERVFHKEGRLSDPDMHGKSARRGKPEASSTDERPV